MLFSIVPVAGCLKAVPTGKISYLPVACIASSDIEGEEVANGGKLKASTMPSRPDFYLYPCCSIYNYGRIRI